MAAGEEARRRCRICSAKPTLLRRLSSPDAIRAVHLLADIGRDRLVEGRLGRRELVAGGVGAALREERRAVEAVELFLGQPPHHVRHVGLVDALAEPPLEAVGVEQPHEELEVRFLAVVRRRRHQQEVARARAEQFAELVALRFLHLAAEIRGRHAVRFVADDEVPIGRGFELRLQFVGARRHVEPHDQAVASRRTDCR